MRLWRICYISVATAPAAVLDADVRAICALAEPHNARAGITGALTFHGGRFAQVLEGPESALRALMTRIAADPRHHSLTVIADAEINARRYADWSMAYRDPRDFVRDQLDTVLEHTAVMAEGLGSSLH